MKKYTWTKKEKDKVEKYVDKYKKEFKIQNWKIYISFENGPVITGDPVRGENFISFATNVTTLAYEKIDIVFHAALLQEIREAGRFELEDTVRHELAHCLTQELFELSLRRFVTEKECVDAVERLTQKISNLV